jgi:hypothetical protein
MEAERRWPTHTTAEGTTTTRTTTLGPHDLPDEIVLALIGCLADARDIGSCAAVCRRWSAVCGDARAWEAAAERVRASLPARYLSAIESALIEAWPPDGLEGDEAAVNADPDGPVMRREAARLMGEVSAIEGDAWFREASRRLAARMGEPAWLACCARVEVAMCQLWRDAPSCGSARPTEPPSTRIEIVGDRYRKTLVVMKRGAVDADGLLTGQGIVYVHNDTHNYQDVDHGVAGHWERGSVVGDAFVLLHDGTRYEGGWSRGMRNGAGRLYSRDGRLHTVGRWEDDKLVGPYAKIHACGLVEHSVAGPGGSARPIEWRLGGRVRVRQMPTHGRDLFTVCYSTSGATSAGRAPGGSYGLYAHVWPNGDIALGTVANRKDPQSLWPIHVLVLSNRCPDASLAGRAVVTGGSLLFRIRNGDAADRVARPFPNPDVEIDAGVRALLNDYERRGFAGWFGGGGGGPCPDDVSIADVKFHAFWDADVWKRFPLVESDLVPDADVHNDDGRDPLARFAGRGAEPDDDGDDDDRCRASARLAEMLRSPCGHAAVDACGARVRGGMCVWPDLGDTITCAQEWAECRLSGCRLSGTIMAGIKIRQCDFRRASFDGCLFYHCVFERCAFYGATFRRCRFVDCVLTDQSRNGWGPRSFARRHTERACLALLRQRGAIVLQADDAHPGLDARCGDAAPIGH